MKLGWLAIAVLAAGLGLTCSQGSEPSAPRPGLDTLRAGLGHVRAVRHVVDQVSRVIEHALQDRELRHVPTGAVWIVGQQDVPGCERVEAHLFEQAFNRALDCTDLRRTEFRLPDQSSFAVEDDTGEIQRLVEDWRISGTHHR